MGVHGIAYYKRFYIMSNTTLSSRDVAEIAMREVWNKTPHSYQKEVIPHIIDMIRGNITPSSILLVQPTGSGKSTVPQTCSVVTNGVTLIMETTISLSSDQISKIVPKEGYNGSTIMSFQLDKFKKKSERQKIVSFITEKCFEDRKGHPKSILLFASAEAMEAEEYKNLFHKLLELKLLRLICIDEVHQYVEFGTTFRPAIMKLKQQMFKFIVDEVDKYKTMIPILFMTATFDLKRFQLLKEMTDLHFFQENIFWGNKASFSKRNIKLQVKYSNQFWGVTKSYIHSKINEDNESSKVIICCNVSKKAEKLQQKLDSWLDLNPGIIGDSILIVGSLETELKIFYTKEFTKKVNLVETKDNDFFYARFLIGTSGCIGAGLDSDDVKYVIRLGMPTSVMNFIQEIGRCGRRISTGEEINIVQDCALVAFNLMDYVYLVERLYIIENDNDQDTIAGHETTAHSDNDSNTTNIRFDKESIRKIQLHDIKEMGKMLVLGKVCWHEYIEHYSTSTFFEENNVTSLNSSCAGNCPICDGSFDSFIERVDKNGLCRFLTYIFLTVGGEYTPLQLSNCLFKYPNVGKEVYRRPHSKKAKSKVVTQITILQLIVGDILTLDCRECDIPLATVKLKIEENNIQPNYLISSYWDNIKHFED